MPRFIAVLNASNPQLAANIASANAEIVAAYEPGVLIISGDQAAADAVAGLQGVAAVSPLDGALDASALNLDAESASLVSSWNRGYDADYVAAVQAGYREGEVFDFPGGCLHSGVEGDETGGLLPGGPTNPVPVASNGGQPTDPAAQPTDPSTQPTDPTQVADNSGQTTDPASPPADGSTPTDGSTPDDGSFA